MCFWWFFYLWQKGLVGLKVQVRLGQIWYDGSWLTGDIANRLRGQYHVLDFSNHAVLKQNYSLLCPPKLMGLKDCIVRSLIMPSLLNRCDNAMIPDMAHVSHMKDLPAILTLGLPRIVYVYNVPHWMYMYGSNIWANPICRTDRKTLEKTGTKTFC